jgi:hypothetical protein
MRLDHIAHLDEIPDRGWVSSNIWDRGLVSAVFVSSLTTAPPFRASSIKSRDPSSESASLREGRDTPICFANSRSAKMVAEHLSLMLDSAHLRRGSRPHLSMAQQRMEITRRIG